MNAPKDDFSDRLEQSLIRQGISNAEFVTLLGGRAQLVSGWRRRGRIGQASIKTVAAILTRTNMTWLNDGIGNPERETNVKTQGPGLGQWSQNEKVAEEILSRAETWVRVEERAKGEFQPVIRARRILELCRMIQANDGHDLSPDQVLALIGALQPPDRG